MSDDAVDATGPAEKAEIASADEQLNLHLELTPEEQEVLGTLLDNYLSDLHVEIGDTDSSEFKKMLRHRLEVLSKIRAALPGPDASTAAMADVRHVTSRRLW